MHRETIHSIAIAVCCVMLAVSGEAAERKQMIVLHAIYSPGPGTDPEHGQGAIERNELEHCPLGATEWLIRVPEPADTGRWQRQLDESVSDRAGTFEVRDATPEELQGVSRGDYRFQK